MNSKSHSLAGPIFVRNVIPPGEITPHRFSHLHCTRNVGLVSRNPLAKLEGLAEWIASSTRHNFSLYLRPCSPLESNFISHFPPLVSWNKSTTILHCNVLLYSLRLFLRRCCLKPCVKDRINYSILKDQYPSCWIYWACAHCPKFLAFIVRRARLRIKSLLLKKKRSVL
jgi:hypothetical protein